MFSSLLLAFLLVTSKYLYLLYSKLCRVCVLALDMYLIYKVPVISILVATNVMICGSKQLSCHCSLSSLPIAKDPCERESNLSFSPVQRHFICNTLIISSSSIHLHLFSCYLYLYLYLIFYLTILPGNLEQWRRPSSSVGRGVRWSWKIMHYAS